MKRLETQAKVAQMKERLRVMGLLDASAAVKIEEFEEVEPEVVSTAATSAPIPPSQRAVNVGELEVFFPPAPPPASQHSVVTNIHHNNDNIIAELKARTDRHRSVLR